MKAVFRKFPSAFLAAVLMFSICLPAFAQNGDSAIKGFTAEDFLTTKGQNIVNQNGEKIQLKGVNLGTYYDCANDEQMMNMSMELYHGDDLILSRSNQLHWWLTGFKISDTLYPAKSQTLKFSIEMKDEEMLNAFCDAVENHYRNDMEYTVDGLTVNIIW